MGPILAKIPLNLIIYDFILVPYDLSVLHKHLNILVYISKHNIILHYFGLPLPLNFFCKNMPSTNTYSINDMTCFEHYKILHFY